MVIEQMITYETKCEEEYWDLKGDNKQINMQMNIIVSGMHGHKNIPSANPLFSGIIMSSPYSPH